MADIPEEHLTEELLDRLQSIIGSLVDSFHLEISFVSYSNPFAQGTVHTSSRT